MMTVDDFFGDNAESKMLFEAVHREINAVGDANMAYSRNEIAFRRKRKFFAFVWMPRPHQQDKVAPLMLTFLLRERVESPRWKGEREFLQGRLTHHIELYEASDIDDEVKDWLREAWEEAV